MQNVILGTMNILYPYSSSSNLETSDYKDMIECYLLETDQQNAILDTAYYYANGKCEQVLGEILPQLSYLPKISTKVNPWFENDFQNGKQGQLSRDNVKSQLTTSLKHLDQPSVEYLYLHCPDYETPIDETLDICDTLWRQEKYNHLGLSNFSLEQVQEVLDVCEKEGIIFPGYYQGMYNLISRKVEEIFPLLDDYNMQFWAYNPLAGGLLSGKYNNNNNVSCNNNNNRFKDNVIYRNIFWKPEILNHLEEDFFQLKPEKSLEYSLQWLQFLSEKQLSDKIIIGASNKEQLIKNMDVLKTAMLYDVRTVKVLKNIYHPISLFSPNYYY